MKGLIIKSKWADLILNRDKTIELRSSNTNIRGTIGIIKSGSKKVYGTVDIIDSIPLNENLYNDYRNKHKVDLDYKNIKYKHLYGWVLENAIKFNKPIPYNHKQGCVIWVNLEGEDFENL